MPLRSVVAPLTRELLAAPASAGWSERVLDLPGGLEGAPEPRRAHELADRRRERRDDEHRVAHRAREAQREGEADAHRERSGRHEGEAHEGPALTCRTATPRQHPAEDDLGHEPRRDGRRGDPREHDGSHGNRGGPLRAAAPAAGRDARSGRPWRAARCRARANADIAIPTKKLAVSVDRPRRAVVPIAMSVTPKSTAHVSSKRSSLRTRSAAPATQQKAQSRR